MLTGRSEANEEGRNLELFLPPVTARAEPANSAKYTKTPWTFSSPDVQSLSETSSEHKMVIRNQ